MTTFRMPAVPNVHGIPGSTLEANSSYGTRNVSRGAFFEHVTARVLAAWLASRPDRDGIHVFHSLGGFGAVSGAGLPAIDAGRKWDLDHLVLTGGRWIMLNSKGIGNGTLAVIGPPPKGVLVKEDGTTTLQPWMDVNTSYAMAGIIYRLTRGMKGSSVWVVPAGVETHKPSIGLARFLVNGGSIVSTDQLARWLDSDIPATQSPADPEAIRSLLKYCTPAPLKGQEPLNHAGRPGSSVGRIDLDHPAAHTGQR